jgi:hypothetical protein
MDSGLIQILVIAFFVIISMMDGVARKKRQEQQREAGPQIGGPEEESDRGDMFSTTRDPISETALETTSEGMVPAELWEEIAALARGGPSPSTRRLPYTSVPEEESAMDPTEASDEEESWLDPAHQHVESHAHVEWEPEDRSTYRTAPSYDDEALGTSTRAATERTERLPVLLPADEPVAARSTEKGTAVRQTLRHQGHASIRQAVILSEVLGPPAALRDVGHEPTGSRR